MRHWTARFPAQPRLNRGSGLSKYDVHGHGTKAQGRREPDGRELRPTVPESRTEQGVLSNKRKKKKNRGGHGVAPYPAQQRQMGGEELDRSNHVRSPRTPQSRDPRGNRPTQGKTENQRKTQNWGLPWLGVERRKVSMIPFFGFPPEQEFHQIIVVHDNCQTMFMLKASATKKKKKTNLDRVHTIC